MVGYTLIVLPLVAAAAGAPARVPGELIVRTLLISGLVVLQAVISIAASGVGGSDMELLRWGGRL